MSEIRPHFKGGDPRPRPTKTLGRVFIAMRILARQPAPYRKLRIAGVLRRIVRRWRDVITSVSLYLRGVDIDGYVSAVDIEAELGGRDDIRNKINAYERSSTSAVESLVSEALATGRDFEAFLDLGCGKGFACIVAAKTFGIADVRGIDVSPTFIETANRNKRKLGLDFMDFQVFDASKYTILKKNTMIFLNNPFDAIIIRNFLLGNLEHFRTFNSTIIYINDWHREIFNEFGFSTMYRSRELRASIWSYRDVG